MSISIYDVAKAAGVSVVTVSRVINHSPTVRESNRLRVQKAIEELDYKPNAAARSLARGMTGNIGVVIPALEDSFMLRVLSAIESTLRNKGLFVILSAISDNEPLSESNCVKLFTEDRVDGILMLKPLKNEPYIRELKKRNFPFVLLDQHHLDKQLCSVTVDNRFGGYQATKKLIDGGARLIAHIKGSPVYQSSHERYEGYLKAMTEAGLPVREELVVQGHFNLSSGYQITSSWLKEGIRPEAIFAADDNMAFGVIEALHHDGLQVPDDVAVVGYDDHPYSATLFSGITTVRQPAEDIAKCGIDLLFQIMNGKVKRNTTITLKPELIVRSTTK